jgi:hypothetical protein
MPILKRRSRMISFRLSEDEYTNLKRLCIDAGARSVSDLARDAVNRLMTKPHNGSSPQFEYAVQALQTRLDAMDLELKRLSVVVQTRFDANAAGD